VLATAELETTHARREITGSRTRKTENAKKGMQRCKCVRKKKKFTASPISINTDLTTPLQ